MKVTSFEAIVRSFDEAGVRYLVAGGLAVNAHGYMRLTKDVDLVLDLHPPNVERALRALEGLGYRPTVPVAAAQFADPEQRRRWIHEKEMKVFQLWSDDHRDTPIDLFVEEPFPFDEEYSRALVKPLYGAVKVRFVSIETLIQMKEAAGRAQDRIDIEHLRKTLEENCEGG
jgi:hypothetical protein